MNPIIHYFRYVLRHKWFVFQECRLLGVGFWQALIHDYSKLSWIEFRAYCDKFERGKTDAETDRRFKVAWLHHIHSNPHHWEHWLMPPNKDGVLALRMPDRYVREMVADWRGVGRALGKGRENAVEWYKKNRDCLALHHATRHRVEVLLGVIETGTDDMEMVEFPTPRVIGT